MPDAIDKLLQRYIEEREWRLREFLAGAPGVESPIEALLLTGLFAIAPFMQIDLRVEMDAAEAARHSQPNRATLIICPQTIVGKYRVDFVGLCSYSEHRGPWWKIAIECDGHDFHERTKEQAARDRARDRFLQDQGYTIYRFTGSEIHRDLYGSAEQIAKWVWDRIKTDAKGNPASALRVVNAL